VDLNLDGDLDLIMTQEYEVNEEYIGDFFYHENVGDGSNMAFASREKNPFDFDLAGRFI